MGGEKIPVEQNEVGIGGSPPRGRGKAFLFGDFDIQRRITPAWAGKSEGTDCARAENGDHPRVGGEKAAYLRAVCGPRGSPPRGRGKGMALTEANRVFGITPAWAGKSDNSENQSSKKQDHPRVGGEKALSSTALGLAIGSPPRGRGKGVLIFPRRAAVGITPAWAGKRRRAGGGTPARQDHPRVGGEKKMYRTAGACFSGSPPRGRGKVAVDHFLHSAAGITPAWAGKRD